MLPCGRVLKLGTAGADVVTVSDTKRLKQLQRDYNTMMNMCDSDIARCSVIGMVLTISAP